MAFDFPNTPANGDRVTGPGGIVYVWDGVKWASSLANTTVQSMGDVGRNILHNGLFNVAQRGNGGFGVNNSYTADRWLLAFALDTDSIGRGNLSDTSRSQIGDEAAIAGVTNTFTGNAGATAFSNISQRIESVRRLSGKTVTVSFFAAATSGTPRLGVSLDQNFGSGGSPSPQVSGAGQSVTLSIVYTRYSLIFTLPSASGMTFGTTPGTDWSALNFWFSAGANTATRAGNIGVQSNAVGLWGIQLEIGNVATPLEKPDFQQELSRCQRFYQIGSVQIQGYNVAGSGIAIMVPFAVAMRAGPVMVPSQVSNTNASSPTIAAADTNVYQVSALATATGGLNWRATFTASADL